MNLNDYLKQIPTLLGGCGPTCTDDDRCQTCRVAVLVGQVWDSGVRSGAAASADRSGRKLPISEWEFDLSDLVGYARDKNPSFSDDQGWRFVTSQLEAMTEWAEAKGERKVNWTSAIKGWMRRSLEGTTSPHSGQRFPTQSQILKQEYEHQETFRRAMSLNSPNAPPSRCPTLSATASRKMRRVSRSSSPTQPRFL